MSERNDSHPTVRHPEDIDQKPYEVATFEGARSRIQNMLLPIKAIAQIYGYQPQPSMAEKIDLGIQWGDEENMLSRVGEFDSLNEGDERATERDGPVAHYFDIPLFESRLKAINGHLDMKATKSIRTDKISGEIDHSLIFQINNPAFPKDGDGYEVCNFVFTRKKDSDPSKDEWNMNDREVLEAYQGQGIASQALKRVEEWMAKRAKETKMPQVMSANVGQVDVLLWMLKEGYKPANEEDNKRIERVMSGDPSLTVVSAPEGTGGGPKQWYIFEKEVLHNESGQQKKEIWDSTNYGKPIHYMKSSFRINLRKEIV